MSIFSFFKKKKKNETFCPKCGTKLLDGFCPKCGQLIGFDKEANRDFIEKDKQEKIHVIKSEHETENELVNITITTEVRENNPFYEPYNETYAYLLFFNKYPVIEAPENRDKLNYVSFEFRRAGVNNINEVRKLHEELFSKGFYKKGNDALLYLNRLKVSELKEISKAFSLQIKGKKDSLIEQLNQLLSFDQLKIYFGYDIYELSEKVDEFKKEHKFEIEYYFELYDNNINFTEFLKLRETRSLDDINFQYHKAEWKHDEFYLGSSHLRWIGKYFLRNNKFKKASEYFLRVLLIELSGAQLNNINWKEFKKARTPKEYWDFWPIEISDNITEKIKKLAPYIDEDLINKVTEYKLPFNACPTNLFKQIIELIINDKFDKETKKKIVGALTENLAKIRKDLYGF
ncbi:hypothetical protein ACUZ9N_01445 [Mycoplasmopsis gallinarum]